MAGASSQGVVHRVARAITAVVPTERTYPVSVGSQLDIPEADQAELAGAIRSHL